MAVLDGKYEILSERSLGAGQSLLGATAPDGRALNIVWFEFSSPEQEARFETYRQALRALKREGWAALHDIVSRPGAHYVAWHAPGNLPSAPPEPALAALLARYGYRPEQADVRGSGSVSGGVNGGVNGNVSGGVSGSGNSSGGCRVYALAFDERALPLGPAEPPPAVLERSSGRWRAPRLSDGALAGLLGLALSGLALLLFALAFGRGAAPLQAVPELVGLEVNGAARQLYELRLAAELQAVPSAEPPMQVLSAEPPPGSLLRAGRSVTLRYAVPPDAFGLTEVPQLRGVSVGGALQAELEAAGLRLGEVAYIHANTPEDVVIGQSLPAGSRARAGSEVTVLASLGPLPAETFLPDLSGMSLEDALEWARLAGLDVLPPRYENAPGFAPDTVVAQSIPPYTAVPERASSLELTLALGPAPEGAEGAPNLIGLSESAARALAAATGLDLEVTLLESPDESLNLPEGVVDQTPPPGTPVSGSLGVLLNLHPQAIPRPEVRAFVRPAETRSLPYRFRVEPGLGRLTARVTATTVAGEVFPVVAGRTVTGGDWLEGVWRTREPGPVTFTLYLGNAVYQDQLVND